MRPVLAVVALLWAGAAHAATVTDIYGACAQHSARCTDFFDGFMEGMLSYSAIIKGKTFFCTDQKITPQAAGKLFVTGVNDDPKLKSAPGAGIAFSVILAKTYPCTDRK
jgi:hypothetical protein